MKILIILITVVCNFYVKAEILGPYVGGVTQTNAVFIIKTDNAQEVYIELSETNDFFNTLRTPAASALSTDFGYLKLEINSLTPFTKYFYRAVIDGTAQGKIHSFKTFPSEKNTDFSFGFGSCMQSPFTRGTTNLFETIGGDSLSFFLQIGDWTYPDLSISRGYNQSEELIAQTYDERYSNEYGFPKHVLSVMPVAYVWDDHDYSYNNSDGSDPNKHRSLSAYTRYFPHYELPNKNNGIWQSFIYGNVEFFMLDLRSQRSPNMNAFDGDGDFDPPDGHSILAAYKIDGVNQRDWLIRALKQSKAKWKVIVSSVLFNPEFTLAIRFPVMLGKFAELQKSLADKWMGFPEDQKLLLKTIDDEDIRNVIVVSGDTHSSFIDDGSHSILPEIGASNLDVANSKMPLQVKEYRINVFSCGSYDEDERCYGRVSFNYSGRDNVLLELVDNNGKVHAACRILECED